MEPTPTKLPRSVSGKHSELLRRKRCANRGAAMDAGGWLRRLGLEQYEATFRENEISEKVLPSLTAEDLKDLGVGMVGHRRMLLEAIAALRAPASAPRPLSDALPVTDEAAKDSAERRQVTVMFSDLVGSTALAARLDLEDLREVISAYQMCVADTVRRFGGFVARYMGDGVLIYFGYPAAHEDDAERAVRAGLALVDAVATLPAPEPVQVRVGAATGMVVVGDLVGSGKGQARDIVGEAPNLAARLQAIAEPNSVVIAEATRDLLGNLFELRDLGPKELKGITGPVKAFAVLRASSVESRFEAMHAGGMTALVGREEEFELLKRRWATAKTGEGQVVLISGEAGIGKSRLSAALMEAIAAEPHTRLRYFCSPQHTDSAFYPLIGQFERAADFAHGDTSRTKLDKLDALLAQTATSRQDAALLAEILSLPNDGRYPALEPVPEQRRQKTLEALGVQVETLARSSPVLMIFEDAQWGDPTSLEAFGRTVDRIASLRVLLIVTFRPEFEAPWVGRPHVTPLALNRLGRHDVGSVIDYVVGNKLLPANIRKDIIERTDGIPLFVEEMTKAVMEAGGQPEAMQTAAATPSPALAVPASLHASLMARLDRLGPAKEVAQVGAAIGREFSHALLAAVVRKPEAELGSELDRLIRAGLLFLKGVPPHATYWFKHALVQDAAYGTLLRQPRRALHARIAETIERQFADIAERNPDQLARHYTEAGRASEAIVHWLKAGQRAIERSADQEAVRHLVRGLALLRTLPESEDRDRHELDFQITLGTPLVAVSGYTSPEVGAASERAIFLSEKLDDVGRLFVSLFSQFTYCNTTGKTRKGLEFARRCQTLGIRKGDRTMQLVGYRAVGAVFMQRGQFALAREQFEQALALHDPERDRSLAVRFMHDPIASSSAYLAIIAWISGYPKRAIDIQARALGYAAELNHVNTSGFVHFYAAWLEQLFGNVPGVLGYASTLAALAKQYRVLAWRNYGMILEGWAVSWTTGPENGISLMQQGIAHLDVLKTTLHVPYLTSLLAQVNGRVGDFQSALALCIDARERAQRSEQYIWEAELHRIEGEVRRDAGHPPTDVENCFGKALAVARAQQAKSFELRAAMSMARLWCDQAKRTEARQLLAPVYGWFTEGFDTLDLKQAKALLDELT